MTTNEQSTLQLRCWLIGDPPEMAFKVTVPQASDVSDLKEAIKQYLGEECRSPSKNLKVWAVAIPSDDKGRVNLAKAEQAANAEAETGRELLQDVPLFRSLNKQHLHVVVKMPEGARHSFSSLSTSDCLILSFPSHSARPCIDLNRNAHRRTCGLTMF
jgi:hypothetical protein